jgi:HD-GYP domain-containing protein (c-di-GMP phosphodiesterase class II)
VQTVLALARAVEAKDTYTADHAEGLANWAIQVAARLGIADTEELRAIRWGAILHDVGKIGVPDSILQKPCKLDADEWKLMRLHPHIGSEILRPVPRLLAAAEIVRHHHERWDGKGYPDGLQGDAIPFGARILTVVDSYSAMIDERVYKSARSVPYAISELQKHKGSQFDAKVVDAFLEVIRISPGISLTPTRPTHTIH